MKILLTGGSGQIGFELGRVLPSLGEVVSTDRGRLDLADSAQIRQVVRDIRPDVIVNAAAYTAVDKAESERDLAAAINETAPAVLAEEARRLGALLIHYSTDYVFDGMKGAPYAEDDPPNPLSVYGKTKLQGEAAIRSLHRSHLILRVAWVYSARGRNFVKSVLAKAKAGEALRVVDDQTGAPTWARDIADVSCELLRRRPPYGTYHVSAQGECSWYGLARELLNLAGIDVALEPIPTSAYPTAAVRPKYSVLDNSRLRSAGVAGIGRWAERLRAMMATQSMQAK